MKRYNKNHCQSCIRNIHKKNGLTVILTGQHAFGWNIIQITKCFTLHTAYPNRQKAQDAYKELIKRK